MNADGLHGFLVNYDALKILKSMCDNPASEIECKWQHITPGFLA